MGRSLLVTGPQSKCSINGKPYGQVIRLMVTSVNPHTERKGIDTLLPIELVPNGSSASGTLQVYKIRRDGGPEAAGMTSVQNSLSRAKLFSILVIDRASDTVLFRSDKCTLDSQLWAFPSKEYIIGVINFKCLDFGNETEQSPEV